MRYHVRQNLRLAHGGNGVTRVAEDGINQFRRRQLAPRGGRWLVAGIGPAVGVMEIEVDFVAEFLRVALPRRASGHSLRPRRVWTAPRDTRAISLGESKRTPLRSNRRVRVARSDPPRTEKFAAIMALKTNLRPVACSERLSSAVPARLDSPRIASPRGPSGDGP